MELNNVIPAEHITEVAGLDLLDKPVYLQFEHTTNDVRAVVRVLDKGSAMAAAVQIGVRTRKLDLAPPELPITAHYRYVELTLDYR